jgi:hypothetical protein
MYDDKRLPDLNDLKEIAWQLRTKECRQQGKFCGVFIASQITRR